MLGILELSYLVRYNSVQFCCKIHRFVIKFEAYDRLCILIKHVLFGILATGSKPASFANCWWRIQIFGLTSFPRGLEDASLLGLLWLMVLSDNSFRPRWRIFQPYARAFASDIPRACCNLWQEHVRRFQPSTEGLRDAISLECWWLPGIKCQEPVPLLDRPPFSFSTQYELCGVRQKFGVNFFSKK